MVIGGRPGDTTLSELEVTQKVLQKIGDSKFQDDIIFVKKRSLKKYDKSSTNSSDLHKTFSIIVRFKSENVRNEVMTLKKLMVTYMHSKSFLKSQIFLVIVY